MVCVYVRERKGWLCEREKKKKKVVLYACVCLRDWRDWETRETKKIKRRLLGIGGGSGVRVR